MEQQKSQRRQSALVPLLAALVLLSLGLASAAQADPTGTVGTDGTVSGGAVVNPIAVTESVAGNTVTVGVGQGSGKAATANGAHKEETAAATVGCIGAASSGTVSGSAAVGSCAAATPAPSSPATPDNTAGNTASGATGSATGDSDRAGGVVIVITATGPATDSARPGQGQQGRTLSTQATKQTPKARAAKQQAKKAQKRAQKKAQLKTKLKAQQGQKQDDCATAVAPASYSGGDLGGLSSTSRGAALLGLLALCFAAGLAGAKTSRLSRRREPALQ